MKKVLAIVICLCIALTVSVSAFAASSPANKVKVVAGIGTKQDGGSIPTDTFVDIADDSSITVVADEKNYGKFDKWIIYIINDNGTYTEAKEGTDYTVKSGSLGDKNLTIVPISRVAITGNYGGKITDPAKPSTAVTSSANSPKTGDVNVAYAIMVLLAAGALVFGAKRQLSK